MCPVISVPRRAAPSIQCAGRRGEDFDHEREAGRAVRRVFGTAIPAWTGAETPEQIDFGEEVDMITGAHRAGLHEILTCVARESCTHEDIENVMNVSFGLNQRQPLMMRERTRQVRVTAMVVVPALQQIARVGITAGTNHIVD